MSDRYEIMKRVRDHLEELFKLCGIKTSSVKIAPAPALVQFAEKIAQDNALYTYLESLDAQAQRAAAKMKERNLEAWNSKENEKYIAELEKQLEQEKAQKEAMQAQQEEMQERLAQGEAQLQEMRDRLEQESGRMQELEQSLSQEKERGEQYKKERLAYIKSLIELRDKLMLRKSWLEDQVPEEVNAKKVVDSQMRELARCLNHLGVEILEADGEFDSRIQTVVETSVTESEELVGKIAETFRPGYRFQDEVLRSQEVVIYTKA